MRSFLAASLLGMGAMLVVRGKRVSALTLNHALVTLIAQRGNFVPVCRRK